MKRPDGKSAPGRGPFTLEATASLFLPELTEDYAQFREFMVHLQQVFFIWDTTGRVVRYVSPAYELIWGRTCQSLRDDISTLSESIHPEDSKRMDRVLATKYVNDGFDEEFRILRPDGDVRWIWARCYPVKDDAGVVTRFAGIAEDLTERKAAQEKAARLVAFIEYSNDAVVSTTPSGVIVGWNVGAKRQYGYSAEEIIGRSLSILFPPGQREEYLEILERIRRGEVIGSYEAQRLRKDGTLTNISIGIVPVEARPGAVTGASKTDHEISRIEQLEAQVVEAHTMGVIGKLATGVAHDFNNLLAVIMSYAEVMLGALGKDDPTRKNAEEIKQVVARASGLTQQLLLISRRQSVRPVVLDLNAVVSEMSTLITGLVGENIRLSLRIDEGRSAIKADAGYLGQLLMNLVINARQAMPDGGDLTVTTQAVTTVPPNVPPGDYIRLTVSDTGIGMSDEIMAHIFEEFFTTKAAGTGLGLATCQAIVRESGAVMAVSSEVGHGTTFEVYFPTVAEALAVPARPALSGVPHRGTGVLLVVDDEPGVRKLVCKLLESLGYEVLRAGNGQEALRVVSEHTGTPIRLVFTDVSMPLMGGPAMVESLRESCPEIRVLYTSGYMADACLDPGRIDIDTPFLAKPYTFAALAGAIHGILANPG